MRIAIVLSISFLLTISASSTQPNQRAFDKKIKQSLQQVPAERVTFDTQDNVQIVALYHAPENLDEPRPAVLMLHGSGQYKELFWAAGVAKALDDNDYHILSIDLRGYGESEMGDPEIFNRNPVISHLDLEAALDWLVERDDVDQSRIALIGSSYGSNIVTSWMMVTNRNIKTIVSLSATYQAFRFLRAYKPSARHPIRSSGLYLASANEYQDYKASQTAKDLGKETEGRTEIKIYKGNAHALGILFRSSSRALKLVDDWLSDELADEPQD